MTPCNNSTIKKPRLSQTFSCVTLLSLCLQTKFSIRKYPPPQKVTSSKRGVLRYSLTFALHSFANTFLATKLSNCAEVRHGLVQNCRDFDGLQLSRFILVPLEAGKLRRLITTKTFTISFSLLEKEKWRLNRVKCASRSVKRLENIANNKKFCPLFWILTILVVLLW